MFLGGAGAGELMPEGVDLKALGGGGVRDVMGICAGGEVGGFDAPGPTLGTRGGECQCPRGGGQAWSGGGLSLRD